MIKYRQTFSRVQDWAFFYDPDSNRGLYELLQLAIMSAELGVFGGTRQPSDVYGGPPDFPDADVGRRRIGQLDFNIIDSFVLKGQKLGSRYLTSPHSEYMHDRPNLACMSVTGVGGVAVGRRLTMGSAWPA